MRSWAKSMPRRSKSMRRWGRSMQTRAGLCGDGVVGWSREAPPTLRVVAGFSIAATRQHPPPSRCGVRKSGKREASAPKGPSPARTARRKRSATGPPWCGRPGRTRRAAGPSACRSGVGGRQALWTHRHVPAARPVGRRLPRCVCQRAGALALRRPLCSSVTNGGRHRWNRVPNRLAFPNEVTSGTHREEHLSRWPGVRAGASVRSVKCLLRRAARFSGPDGTNQRRRLGAGRDR